MNIDQSVQPGKQQYFTIDRRASIFFYDDISVDINPLKISIKRG